MPTSCSTAFREEAGTRAARADSARPVFDRRGSGRSSQGAGWTKDDGLLNGLRLSGYQFLLNHPNGLLTIVSAGQHLLDSGDLEDSLDDRGRAVLENYGSLSSQTRQQNPYECRDFDGACRDRTGDLRLAKPALSQLS